MPSPVYRRVLVGVSALALGLGGALVTAAPASAAHLITVTDPSGSAAVSGSLPAAIIEANGDPGSTIEFSPSIVGTITIVDLMTIEESVTIIGPGQGVLTIDAPGTVFTVNTALDPIIDVTISGLTLIDSTAAGDCGIDAFDTNLTIFDLNASGFACSGVSVIDGSLVATDVTVNDNNSAGISFFGDGPTEGFTLTRIVANGNLLTGINATTTDAISSITDAQLDDNSIGAYVVARGGSVAISNARASGSDLLGIAAFVWDGAIATITESSATSSPGQGFLFGADGSSRITASHLTATANEVGGVEIGASDSSTVELTASQIEDNGDPCGCGLFGGILIDTDESTVTVSGSHVVHNFAESGGGIYVRSGSGASGSVTIADSTIYRNEANNAGGGIYVEDYGSGAVTGPLTIVRSTISVNTAPDGAGVVIDGFSHAAGGEPVVVIDSSTISGNISVTSTGAGYVTKYGDTGAPGIFRMINSTVSGNEAPSDVAGFGTYGDGGVSTGQMVSQFFNSTIAANLLGPGLLVGGSQTVELSHAIIADNDVSDLEQFLDDPLALTIEYSLIETPGASVTVPAAPGNIVGVDPALGALKDNGGPTHTMLIAPGSAAYNAGNPAIVGAPAYDQRGLGRIYQTIDLGAVEWHPALAATGSEPEPEPGLVGLLLLFTGLALLAASRRFAL